MGRPALFGSILNLLGEPSRPGDPFMFLTSTTLSGAEFDGESPRGGACAPPPTGFLCMFELLPVGGGIVGRVAGDPDSGIAGSV